MGIATHHPPPTAHGTPGAPHRPAPVDPERDIDAKWTAIWVLSGAAVLFASLYFLLPVFDFVLTHERDRKIENLPTRELDDVVGAERSFLRGEESKSKKTIEQVMAEMLKAAKSVLPPIPPTPPKNGK